MGTIYTLPSGYRPAAQEAFPVLTGIVGVLARVDITSAGAVVLRFPLILVGGSVTPDGITFRAA